MISTRVQAKHIRSYCVRPSHNHILMVHIPSTEKVIPDSSPDGLCFNATYVHGISGEPIRELEVHLMPDQRVYFVASSAPNWYYVVQWSGYHSRFGCSCLRGKQYNETHQECEHMRMVAAEVK